MNELKKKERSNFVTNQYLLNVAEVYKPIVRNNHQNRQVNVNNIVWNNIQNGGVICENIPRSNINSSMCSRFLTDYSTSCLKDVETEFYLRHGENSSCSTYWKNRHQQ